jgi:hypothetical protein
MNMLFYFQDKRPTAGVTGKRGIWRKKPPDAESAAWGRSPESVGECPHLSGARGVGRVLQDDFGFMYRWVAIFQN